MSSQQTPEQNGRIPMLQAPDYRLKSRGSRHQVAGRFERSHSYFEAGSKAALADIDQDGVPLLQTQVSFERARSIITRNQSPDVPFNLSINPYRGCEHGCSYCFARPSHSYLDLSPGLDFETKLVVKENAPELLIQALSKKDYRCEQIALGVNTDCYQPIESKYQLTRRLLKICLAFKQPVSIVTKGSLLERDLDLLAQLNEHRLVSVAISLTTLNASLKGIMEPRAAGIQKRLDLIGKLIAAHIPVTVLMAPVIPKLNDQEIEAVLKKIAALGVRNASYVLLRLPHEMTELFTDWLEQHFPLRAQSVLNAMKACHEGNLYRSDFGKRQTGSGVLSELIRQRFQITAKKLGINERQHIRLRTDRFQLPSNLTTMLEPMDWQLQRQNQRLAQTPQMPLF